MGSNKAITVEVIVAADAKKAWHFFTDTASVTRWNFASPDWHCPRAVNDLKAGGAFSYRMEPRDGSSGFDFSGTYTELIPHSKIAFELGDGRRVSVEFRQEGDTTRVTETFETESENSAELQRSGWQAILDNYKKCAEEAKIIPHIWFEDQALEAAKLYVGLFADSKLLSDVSLDGTPSGSITVLNLRLADLDFQFLNAGPLFDRNPSVSYMVACPTAEEVDRLWNGLSSGAEILMPLDAYDFSGRYGWLKDRFGVSWQLMLSPESAIQKITPAFLFVNAAFGKAEAAMNRLISLFPDSGLVGQIAYHQDEHPDGGKKTLDYARFKLAGHEFVFMDSGFEHKFGFNEMQSLIVECEDQKELDYYWNALSHDKSAEQCGWLKDEFGISWQIVPKAMERMMKEGNKAQLSAVTDAFLKMKKFDIAALEEAYARGASQSSSTQLE